VNGRRPPALSASVHPNRRPPSHDLQSPRRCSGDAGAMDSASIRGTHMNDTDKRRNVLPGPGRRRGAARSRGTGGGDRRDRQDERQLQAGERSMGSGHSMAGMNGEGMNHMALPAGRVTDKPLRPGRHAAEGHAQERRPGVHPRPWYRTATPTAAAIARRSWPSKGQGMSAEEVSAEHHARSGSIARPAARSGGRCLD